MMILGIDPGEKSGWCLYDAVARRVVASGQFIQAALPWHALADAGHPPPDVAVVERPRAFGATRPQVVDCAWHAGQLFAAAAMRCRTVAMYRGDVCKILGTAVGATIKGDSAVWQALCVLHPGSDRRPVAAKPAGKRSPEVAAVEAGPLFGTVGHARAALALCVGYMLDCKDQP